jgi:hypothetical protein
MKEVQGEVTWVGKNRIAVVYAESGTSESEILLPFDKDVKLEHIQQLGQIAQGDIVRIQYEEVVEESAQGRKEERKAKVISFVRSGLRAPKPPLVDEDGGVLLRSN